MSNMDGRFASNASTIFEARLTEQPPRIGLGVVKKSLEGSASGKKAFGGVSINFSTKWMRSVETSYKTVPTFEKAKIPTKRLSRDD